MTIDINEFYKVKENKLKYSQFLRINYSQKISNFLKLIGNIEKELNINTKSINYKTDNGWRNTQNKPRMTLLEKMNNAKKNLVMMLNHQQILKNNQSIVKNNQ